MLLEDDPTFFGPRAALAIEKLGEIPLGLTTPSLQGAMDRVLEMEAKPEFVQSKEYEALGQFLPASEVLRQVRFMRFL
jgi:hypothetical protein